MRRAGSEQAQHAGEPQEVQSILTCGTKPASTSSSGRLRCLFAAPEVGREDGELGAWPQKGFFIH